MSNRVSIAKAPAFRSRLFDRNLARSTALNKTQRTLTASIVRGRPDGKFNIGSLQFECKEPSQFYALMSAKQFRRLFPTKHIDPKPTAVLTPPKFRISSNVLSVVSMDIKAIHAAQNIQELPILVQFDTDIKNIDAVDIDSIRNFVNIEGSVVAGPHFGERIFFGSQWISIRSKQSIDANVFAAKSRLITAAETVAGDGSTDWINFNYKKNLLQRIRDAMDDLDFFDADLDLIQRFESLVKDTKKRAKPNTISTDIV